GGPAATPASPRLLRRAGSSVPRTPPPRRTDPPRHAHASPAESSSPPPARARPASASQSTTSRHAQAQSSPARPPHRSQTAPPRFHQPPPSLARRQPHDTVRRLNARAPEPRDKRAPGQAVERHLDRTHPVRGTPSQHFRLAGHAHDPLAFSADDHLPVGRRQA